MCVCKRIMTVRMGWDHMVLEVSVERFVFRVRLPQTSLYE
jgi:hypothetical protein